MLGFCRNSSQSYRNQSLQIINAGERVEKKEPSYIVGRTVNLCSGHGEQYGGAFILFYFFLILIFLNL